MKQEIEPILLTYKQAAEYLSVSYNLLRRLINEKKINSIRLGPKLVRVSREDLDRYISELHQEGSGHVI